MVVVVYTFVDNSLGSLIKGPRSTMSPQHARRKGRFNHASAISCVRFSTDSRFTPSMTRLKSAIYTQLRYRRGSPICPASDGDDRGSNVSISLGGNLAKSLLTSASVHWSPSRWNPSLSSQQIVYGADKPSVELRAMMELLLESGKREDDSIAGLRV